MWPLFPATFDPVANEAAMASRHWWLDVMTGVSGCQGDMTRCIYVQPHKCPCLIGKWHCKLGPRRWSWRIAFRPGTCQQDEFSTHAERERVQYYDKLKKNLFLYIAHKHLQCYLIVCDPFYLMLLGSSKATASICDPFDHLMPPYLRPQTIPYPST